jgi:hypothetical protein
MTENDRKFEEFHTMKKRLNPGSSSKKKKKKGMVPLSHVKCVE